MTSDGATLRTAFVLPGLHRVNRGAEVAFESVARELARLPEFDVTLIGSGPPRAGEPYRYLRAGCVDRSRFERFPRLPVLRGEASYEELTFLPGLLRRFRAGSYDVVVCCSFPLVHWLVRMLSQRGPAHVYVTQNGDWPCQRVNSEFRGFACDALVCTNPDYYERNRARWRCALIPNGVDPERFRPGPASRPRFGLPEGVPLVLMVSAHIASKRVLDGIRAVARLPDHHLAVAGDGPLRDEAERLAAVHMPGRYHRLSVERAVMPDVYRSADVFLHMSKDEPSSNAYIEALATGLPIVTHDRPVTRWTFDSTAALVDTDDLDAVADAVRRAAGEPAGLRETRTRLAAERFAWSGIAAQYASFLRTVADERRRDGGRRVAAVAGAAP